MYHVHVGRFLFVHEQLEHSFHWVIPLDYGLSSLRERVFSNSHELLGSRKSLLLSNFFSKHFGRGDSLAMDGGDIFS